MCVTVHIESFMCVIYWIIYVCYILDNTCCVADCSEQDEKLSLIFTIASFMNNFLTLPNGFLFDRFGTMVTRLLGM